MDYEWLSKCCIKGWTGDAEQMIRESEEKDEKVDIFWNNNELIHMSAIWGGAEVLKVLIDYYEKNVLQGDQESDEYLHARESLVEAVEETIFSTGTLEPDVMEILNKYRQIDDTDSLQDFEELYDLSDKNQEDEYSGWHHETKDSIDTSSTDGSFESDSGLQLAGIATH